MGEIEYVTLDAADASAARRFYAEAFGLDDRSQVRVREAGAESSGFRGFTLSLTVAQPSVVDSYVRSALDAGATVLKPAAKSLWGYGCVVQAPDGAIWNLATSAKKDAGPVERRFDALVLLLGVADVPASRRFYTGQGFTVGKSFARMYVEFEAGDSPVKLGLYRRRALAKSAGVPAEGSGSHGITIAGDAGAATDPDGFAWEAAAPAASAS
ncbi:glyoxalase [Streptomyces sp. NPDC051940]|uniref:glyoxalase n=1 Tax=Streptomyces sp. NPDC051940 TaxID=3155675 RepID=UPI0034124A32